MTTVSSSNLPDASDAEEIFWPWPWFWCSSSGEAALRPERQSPVWDPSGCSGSWEPKLSSSREPEMQICRRCGGPELRNIHDKLIGGSWVCAADFSWTPELLSSTNRLLFCTICCFFCSSIHLLTLLNPFSLMVLLEPIPATFRQRRGSSWTVPQDFLCSQFWFCGMESILVIQLLGHGWSCWFIRFMVTWIQFLQEGKKKWPLVPPLKTDLPVFACLSWNRLSCFRFSADLKSWIVDDELLKFSWAPT